MWRLSSSNIVDPLNLCNHSHCPGDSPCPVNPSCWMIPQWAFGELRRHRPQPNGKVFPGGVYESSLVFGDPFDTKTHPLVDLVRTGDRLISVSGTRLRPTGLEFSHACAGVAFGFGGNLRVCDRRVTPRGGKFKCGHCRSWICASGATRAYFSRVYDDRSFRRPHEKGTSTEVGRWSGCAKTRVQSCLNPDPSVTSKIGGETTWGNKPGTVCIGWSMWSRP